MGAIHVHEFMSLDGVIDTPSWTFPFGFPDKLAERFAEVTGRCRGILMGRVTYEMFAPSWSIRTVEDDPGAPFFNDTPKFIVSSTLTDPAWKNSTVLDGYDPAAIAALKSEVGDLYVSGSGTLVRAMLADGLVDELHICVYPLTRGSGPRLFADGTSPIDFTLAAGDVLDNGALYLNYKLKA